MSKYIPEEFLVCLYFPLPLGKKVNKSRLLRSNKIEIGKQIKLEINASDCLYKKHGYRSVKLTETSFSYEKDKDGTWGILIINIFKGVK